jgi:uncharacterized protein
MTVALLGASDNKERYACRAFTKLVEKGHEVFPINPRLASLEGRRVYASLSELEPGTVDTVSVYVSPTVLEAELDALIKLKPRRVILNPGAESELAIARLRAAGIEPLGACTLVMLGTGAFEKL